MNYSYNKVYQPDQGDEILCSGESAAVRQTASWREHCCWLREKTVKELLAATNFFLPLSFHPSFSAASGGRFSNTQLNLPI